MIKLNSQNMNKFVRNTKGRLPKTLRNDISIKPIGKQKYIHLATPDMAGLPMDSYDAISGPVNAYNRKLAIKHIIDSQTSNLGKFADLTENIGLPINISSGKTVKAEINQIDSKVDVNTFTGPTANAQPNYTSDAADAHQEYRGSDRISYLTKSQQHALHTLDDNKLYDTFAPGALKNHYKPLTKKQLDLAMAKEFPYAKKLLSEKHTRAHHLSNKRPSWTTPSDITPDDIPDIDKIRNVVEKQAQEANQVAKKASLTPHDRSLHVTANPKQSNQISPDEVPPETPHFDETMHDSPDVDDTQAHTDTNHFGEVPPEVPPEPDTVFNPHHEDLGGNSQINPNDGSPRDPSVNDTYNPTLEEQGAVAPHDHNDPKMNRPNGGGLDHGNSHNEQAPTPKGMDDASFHLPNINESFVNHNHKGFGEHGTNLHHFSHKQVDEANRRSQSPINYSIPKESEIHLTPKEKKFGLTKAGKRVEIAKKQVFRQEKLDKLMKNRKGQQR